MTIPLPIPEIKLVPVELYYVPYDPNERSRRINLTMKSNHNFRSLRKEVEKVLNLTPEQAK